MKIGIYGGSFNPFHLGHEKIVHFVLETLKLDKIIIIPVGIPSHRENNLEDSNIRLEICKKVFEDFDKVEVSDIEIKSKEKSYTYDTLLKIMEIYGKENDYYEIIGEDSLNYFHAWKNYEKILELAKIIVLRRKLDSTYTNNNILINQKKIIFLENPFYDISSTEIRKKIKNKEDISNLVNEKVKDIILKEMIDNV